MSAHPPSPGPSDAIELAADRAPTQPDALWCLRFLSGAMRGRTVLLHAGVNVLGSGADCDVLLPGGDVLSQHLVLNVGEISVSMQQLGSAPVRLNGDELIQARRNVVVGDVVALGGVSFQLDRNYPAVTREDPMFATGPTATASAPPKAQAGLGRSVVWLAVAVLVFGLGGLTAVLLTSRSQLPGNAHGVNLSAVEKALAPFPEVEVLAAPGGRFNVKGYVESRQRRQQLERAMQPFGPSVSVAVHAAEDVVEQARRFVADPAIAVNYGGQGRLVLSGVAEDDGVRAKIRRLAEDLHPSVLVFDRVQYREKPRAALVDPVTQWESWQRMMPARMVGITQDERGVRYVQLANGNRLYEGALLRSGVELKRIGAEGLEFSEEPAGTPASGGRR